MGTLYDFACSRCSYTIMMSSGPDAGESGYYHAALCHTCRPKTLVNAAQSVEPFERRSTDAKDYVCPRSRTHRLTLWGHPGPCPRCGTTLLRGTNMLMWD